MLKDAWQTVQGYHVTTERTRRAHALLHEQQNQCGAPGLFLRGRNLPGETGTVLLRTTQEPSDEALFLTQQQPGRPDEDQPLQEETDQKKTSVPPAAAFSSPPLDELLTCSRDVCRLVLSLLPGFSGTWVSSWLAFLSTC